MNAMWIDQLAKLELLRRASFGPCRRRRIGRNQVTPASQTSSRLLEVVAVEAHVVAEAAVLEVHHEAAQCVADKTAGEDRDQHDVVLVERIGSLGQRKSRRSACPRSSPNAKHALRIPATIGHQRVLCRIETSRRPDRPSDCFSSMSRRRPGLAAEHDAEGAERDASRDRPARSWLRQAARSSRRGSAARACRTSCKTPGQPSRRAQCPR